MCEQGIVAEKEQLLGEAQNAVFLLGTEMMDQGDAAESQEAVARQLRKSMSAAKSSAVKLLHQIMTRMVKGELAMRMVMWKATVKDEQAAEQEAHVKQALAAAQKDKALQVALTEKERKWLCCVEAEKEGERMMQNEDQT